MMQLDFSVHGQQLTRIYDRCVEIECTIVRFGDSFEVYAADNDFQHSLAFTIWQVGELSEELSPEYCKATEDRIRWEKIKTLGDCILHSYDSVDKTDIWTAATVDIPALKAFCEEELAKARQE